MFKFFLKEEIERSLEGVRRQYLVGELERPQTIRELVTPELEIGITSYIDFHSEPAHYHTISTEYQYVISGWTQYMDVETKEVFEFREGDFYAIYPNTKYAQKSKPGTTILFIKVPSVRDKTISEVDAAVAEWLNVKLKTVRKDYYYQDDAPKPNSIRPAAAVAVVNGGRVLMVKRNDSGNWTLPGGTLDLGESMTDCAIRELREETGLDVSLVDIIGTYTDPNILIEYSDGEVRQEFTIVYYGTASTSHVFLDDESCGYAWIDLEEIDNVAMADSQRRRLEDVASYLSTNKKHMG